MQPTHTPSPSQISRQRVTTVILAAVALLLCATITRPAHAVAALALVVLVVLREEGVA
jgi:hypothetical protein